MNRDAFKVMLIQHNLIPEEYETNISYLSIDDVYNLSLTCKSVRFQIENFCKSLFEDFEIFKFEKYKTWFNTLLFRYCKLPKIIIRNLIKDNIKLNSKITFIPIISLDHEIHLNLEREIMIYPRIEFKKHEGKIRRCIDKNNCDLHGRYRKHTKTRIFGCKFDNTKTSYSCLFNFIENWNIKQTQINVFGNSEESDDERYNNFLLKLSSVGYFALDLNKLNKEFNKEFKKESFSYSKNKQKFIDVCLENLDQIKKYDKDIPDQIVINNRQYTINKKINLLITSVCDMFLVEKSLFNFIELCYNKKFVFGSYCVFKF